MGPGDTADLRGLICASCARHSSYWDAAPLTLDVLPADVHHGDHSYETPLTPVLRGVFIEHENGDHAVDDGGFRFPKQARFDQHRTILPAPILPASSAAAALMTGRGKLPLRDARLPFLPVFRSSILRRLWALRVLNPDVPESVHVLKSLSPMKPLSSLAAPPPARSAALKAWSALQHQQISPQGSLLGFWWRHDAGSCEIGKKSQESCWIRSHASVWLGIQVRLPKGLGKWSRNQKGHKQQAGCKLREQQARHSLGPPTMERQRHYSSRIGNRHESRGWWPFGRKARGRCGADIKKTGNPYCPAYANQSESVPASFVIDDLHICNAGSCEQCSPIS